MTSSLGLEVSASLFMSDFPESAVVVEELVTGGCASTAGPFNDDVPSGEFPGDGPPSAGSTTSDTASLGGGRGSRALSPLWFSASISASCTADTGRCQRFLL